MADHSSSEVSPHVAPLGVPYYALDTLELIGRQAELAAIDEALGAHSGQSTNVSHAIVFRGPGGVGKTRLLREAVERAQQQKMLTTDIIDLYHSDIHSNSGIERAIIDGLSATADTDVTQLIRDSFQSYESLRHEFDTLRSNTNDIQRIESVRARLRPVFIECYNNLTARYPVLLVLDTAELVQFESDIIQRLCQIENVPVEVKAWLTTTLPLLHNSVILLAGRGPRPDMEHDPRRQLWNDIKKSLEVLEIQWFDLHEFTEEDGVRYFDAVADLLRSMWTQYQTGTYKEEIQRAVKSIQDLETEDRRSICRNLGGRPIRLGLFIDLLAAGEDLAPVAAVDAKWDETLQAAMIGRLTRISPDVPLRIMLDYLAATRHGLNAPLLNVLQPEWTIEDCQQRLNLARKHSFVKTRPHSDMVFLHDEMYDLLDTNIVQSQYDRFRTFYKKIAGYYEAFSTQPSQSDSAIDHETLQVLQVHYRLHDDPALGYAAYAGFDQVAIESYEFGHDMRLRDEILRFYDNKHHDTIAKNRRVPRTVLDCDSAVRWVQRHLSRGETKRAAEVAEILLAHGPEPYPALRARQEVVPYRLSTQDASDARHILSEAGPFFWGRLLTFYGEALLKLEAPHKKMETVLDTAIQLLEDTDVSDIRGMPGSVMPMILWHAYDNRSRFYRTYELPGQTADLRRKAEGLEQILQVGPAPYPALIANRGEPRSSRAEYDIHEVRRLYGNAYALFWSKVLVEYGDALVYLAVPFADTERVLHQAIDLLKNLPVTDKAPSGPRLQLLGASHNLFGYLNRTHGFHGQAREEYQRALGQYPQSARTERATTQTNLSYVLSLLGLSRQARANIEDAIQIQRSLGNEEDLALAYNALGLIHTRDGHPDWGAEKSREVLRICQTLNSPRVEGLALLGLAYALRQQGEQWKLDVCTTAQAKALYDESASSLLRAVEIFISQVIEPSRLWEAYNELGSVHGDMGWLVAKSRKAFDESAHESALRLYEESIEYQVKAEEVAQEHSLPLQLIDSHIDRAQVYGDRSFLFATKGEQSRAQADRNEGERLLQVVRSSLAPQNFRLVSGIGFVEPGQRGIAHLLHLGKSHMWRGVWAFRDVEYGVIADDQRQDRLRKATHELITAAAYFQHYWRTSPDLDRALTYLGYFFKQFQVPPEWANRQISEFQQQYPEIDLTAVREAIEDIIGQ